jgi:hypothetical protein
MRMRGWVAGLAGLALASCGFENEVFSFRIIDRTRVMGTKVEVVELGPLVPERIGFDPDDPPIIEAMPGDRVRLSALIVDERGRQLPAADFDVLWFQCVRECPVQAPPCEDFEWTTDTKCALGRGGEFEFEVPPVGPTTLQFSPGYSLRAVIALDSGIDAERCAALFLEPGPDLRRCAIVDASLQLGPRWPLLVELAESGQEVEVPIFEIPWLALLQPANRAPLPTMPVWFDVETGDPVEGEPMIVRPGQHLRGEGPVWRGVDAQPHVVARRGDDGETWVFLGAPEILFAQWLASSELRLVATNSDFVELVVRDEAEPGPASAVMLFGDHRVGDRTLDIRVVEFEVVP